MLYVWYMNIISTVSIYMPDEESHSADAPLERPYPRKRPRAKQEFLHSVIRVAHAYF